MLPLMQLHCCPLLGKPGLAAAPIVQPPPHNVLFNVRELNLARQTRILATPIAGAGPAATAPLQQSPSAHTQPSPAPAHRQQAPIGAEAQQKYLSYAEYVAMQEQRQREQGQQSVLEGAGQRADETAHASTSAPSQEGSGKRVPWNKGRKHSAMTIARITEATTRALARPEIRAKLDAWNQSRIGSKVPEERKASIAEAQRAAMAARRQKMSPEDVAAYKAKRSAVAKRLWQNADYAERTRAAIQAAGSRRRTRQTQRASTDGADAAASSSSSSARKGSRRRAAVADSSNEAAAGVQVAVEMEGQQWQQQEAPKKAAKKPSQKELAALAQREQEHQQEQLQKQLDRMLQTQRLVATTEQTIQQLRSNMAAFENNPQAKAKAAAALQQAQAYLEPARLQVNKIEVLLDKHGVHWDPATGRMTHINHQALGGKQEPQARKGSKAAGAAQHGSSGSSSNSSGSSGGSSRSGSRRQAAAAAPADPGPDVVRSSRNAARQHTGAAEAASVQHTADGLVVSSRRRAAAAEAAASGGSRVGVGLKPLLTPVDSAVGQNGTHSNGHSSTYNGNGKNGHSSGGGSHYVPLQTQQSLSSVEDDEL